MANQFVTIWVAMFTLWQVNVTKQTLIPVALYLVRVPRIAFMRLAERFQWLSDVKIYVLFAAVEGYSYLPHYTPI
jgi:hypothetical protein